MAGRKTSGDPFNASEFITDTVILMASDYTNEYSVFMRLSNIFPTR